MTAFFALLLGLAPLLVAPPDLPDTPAGEAAAAFLQAIDDGGAPALQAFVEEYLAASLREAHPMDRHLSILSSIAAELAGAAVTQFEEDGSHILRVTLLDAKGASHTLTFQVESEPPHGLLGIEAGEVVR